MRATYLLTDRVHSIWGGVSPIGIGRMRSKGGEMQGLLDWLVGWKSVSPLLQKELKLLRANPVASLAQEEVVIGAMRS
jgi:hypothetical protein